MENLKYSLISWHFFVYINHNVTVANVMCFVECEISGEQKENKKIRPFIKFVIW